SATYLGNQTTHLWTTKFMNPAVYIPGNCSAGQYGLTAAGACSTTANQNQRRVLSLANPATGQFYGSIQKVDSGGTASYNGLLLSVQRRAARGVTVSANYTWSHCISDPGGLERAATNGVEAYSNPDNRRFDRGNCTLAATDRRQVLGLSAVADSPRFSNTPLRLIGSGWRLSPIFKVLSGDYFDIQSGQDRALNGGGNQHVNQVLANPYGDKTAGNDL